MCVLFIALTILLLLIVVILLPVTVQFYLKFNKNAQSFEWRIGIFHDLIYKRFHTVPQNKYMKNQKTKAMLSLLQQAMCRLTFWQVDVFVLLGIGDAAQTAVCCGLLDAVLNAMGSALLPRGKKGRGFLIRTTPEFGDTTFKAQIHGIFRFRLAQIILAAFTWRKALKT